MCGEPGPALIIPPMRALEMQRSQVLSLTCEVGPCLSWQYGGMGMGTGTWGRALVCSEPGPALIIPPMRALEVQRSRVLSLTSEVGPCLTGQYGGTVGDTRRAERWTGQVDLLAMQHGLGSSGQGKRVQQTKGSSPGQPPLGSHHHVELPTANCTTSDVAAM